MASAYCDQTSVNIYQTTATTSIQRLQTAKKGHLKTDTEDHEGQDKAFRSSLSAAKELFEDFFQLDCAFVLTHTDAAASGDHRRERPATT